MTMNKRDLINAVAGKSEFLKKDVEVVLDAFTEVVTEALIRGDIVKMVGFGSFEAVERPEHEGRNPSTGEVIKIAKSKAPRFKAGKSLKEAVKNS